MKVMLDPWAKIPVRVHDTDAGLDLCAAYEQTVPPRGSAVFRTGVHVELPPGTCGLLVSKSGLNVNADITSTGLIDETYSGEIKVKLYNHGNKAIIIAEGQRISQLVVLPVRYEAVELVDALEVRGRGNNGFGSTGK